MCDLLQIAGAILCPHCGSYSGHEIASAICMQIAHEIAHEIARVTSPLTNINPLRHYIATLTQLGRVW
jgi:hypothetical protein